MSSQCFLFSFVAHYYKYALKAFKVSTVRSCSCISLQVWSLLCLTAWSGFVPSIFCESEENSWKPFGNSFLHLFAFKVRLFQEILFDLVVCKYLFVFIAVVAHTPDNSFLGFVVEQHLNASDIKHIDDIKRQNQSLVYGKVDNFWKVNVPDTFMIFCRFFFCQLFSLKFWEIFL